MRRTLTLAALLAVGVTGLPAPTADATTPPTVQPARRYVAVRVATGDPGNLPTAAQVTAATQAAARYWTTVPGAPRVTVTVIPDAIVSPLGRSCTLDSGRRALAANGHAVPDDTGVITFLPGGYPCPHYGVAQAYQPGSDIEAFGTGVTWRDLAHELGHNLGLCAGTTHDRQAVSRWTPDWATGPTSYGNPYSIMGGGDGPPSAPCQQAAGWLEPAPLPAGPPVKVNAIEGAGTNRAAQFSAGGHVWTLEYRKGAGVALYRDGLILETRFNRYVLPAGWYSVGGVTVRVYAVRPGYAYVQRR